MKHLLVALFAAFVLAFSSPAVEGWGDGGDYGDDEYGDFENDGADDLSGDNGDDDDFGDAGEGE